MPRGENRIKCRTRTRKEQVRVPDRVENEMKKRIKAKKVSRLEMMFIKRMTELNNSRRCIKSKKMERVRNSPSKKNNNKIAVEKTVVVVGTDIRSLFKRGPGPSLQGHTRHICLFVRSSSVKVYDNLVPAGIMEKGFVDTLVKASVSVRRVVQDLRGKDSAVVARLRKRRRGRRRSTEFETL